MPKIKTVCGVIAFVFFFLMLGTVGAIEQDQVALGPGIIRAFVFEALWAVFCKLAGAFDPIPTQERRKPHEVQGEDVDACPGRTSRQGANPYGRAESHR